MKSTYVLNTQQRYRHTRGRGRLRVKNDDWMNRNSNYRRAISTPPLLLMLFKKVWLSIVGIASVYTYIPLIPSMLAPIFPRKLLDSRISAARTRTKYLASFHARLDPHSHLAQAIRPRHSFPPAALAHRIPTLPSTVRCISNLRKPQAELQAFHSQLDNPAAASVLNSFKASSPVSRTPTEKIVQKHAVGLPDGKFVKSGDYVTLRSHKCMTHDK